MRGAWRLRLPLPFPGVPHCNAWALSAGDGIVLVDTGAHGPRSMEDLERALGQVDRRIDDVMQFEKWKAQWRGSSDRRLSLSRFLGRLRYPPR